MKNRALLYCFLLLSLVLTFFNHRVYVSYTEQFTILGDINSGSFEFLNFSENMEVDFPNTSVTSMNLKSVKARYLIKNEKIDEALNLLNSIKYDPLKMSEVQKAEIYFYKSKLDSMFNSSKTAFETLPLNQAHLVWYLKSLSTFKLYSEIPRIYEKYKDKMDTIKWFYFYFSAAYGIMNNDNSKLIKNQAKETLYKLQSKNDLELNTILYYILFGEESYKESLKYSKNAAEMFSINNYQEASENYQNAIDRFPINPDHYYNKMASLFKLEKHYKIKETYELMPDSINPGNGQFEFLMARSYMSIKDTTIACDFFNKSKSLNFNPSVSYYKNLCFEEPNE